MARTRQVASNIVAQDERTWRFTGETALGDEGRIDVHRELINKDADGNPVGVAASGNPRGERGRDITRKVSQIIGEAETVVINGQRVTVTAAMILAALPQFFDRWSEEDEAAEAAAAAARAQEAQQVE